MENKIKGTFEVDLKPLEQDIAPDAKGLGRMSIDKQFLGELTGVSKGQMLSAMGGVKGSAGYVAIEVVDGQIGDRKGTFVLQHTGLMDRGAPSLVVTVVPDSGTGDFEGMKGAMEIIIDDQGHHYVFEYSLP